MPVTASHPNTKNSATISRMMNAATASCCGAGLGFDVAVAVTPPPGGAVAVTVGPGELVLTGGAELLDGEPDCTTNRHNYQYRGGLVQSGRPTIKINSEISRSRSRKKIRNCCTRSCRCRYASGSCGGVRCCTSHRLNRRWYDCRRFI